MGGPEPTYEELLRMGWALFWRGVGSFIILLFGVNILILLLVPELTRTEPSFWVAVLPAGHGDGGLHVSCYALCRSQTGPNAVSWIPSTVRTR